MAVGSVSTPATVQLPPSNMSAPMPPCAPAVPPPDANAPSAGAPRPLPLAAAVALARPIPRAPAPPSPKRRATPHPVVTIDLNDSSSSSSSGEGSPSSPVYSPAASDEEDVEDGAARWADGVWKWERDHSLPAGLCLYARLRSGVLHQRRLWIMSLADGWATPS